jgi:hypothetical protein
MSYTEIYKFKKNGDAQLFDEHRNAHRWAMAIWIIMEELYLPSYIPEWAKSLPASMKKEAYSRNGGTGDDSIKEIWNIYKDPNVSKRDKLVLGSTFDEVIILKENLAELIEAYRDFGKETNGLKIKAYDNNEWSSGCEEIASILEEILNDEDAIAIAFGISLSSNQWTYGEENEETGEYSPYNILKHDNHWDLFESFKENASN